MLFTPSSSASPNPPSPTVQEGGRLLRRPTSSAPTRQRPALWLLALLVSLPACLPLLQPGFFASDDGLFHLYRVAALADALRQGVIYPRWFPEFGFGYGQPVLHFYSPLSYYLAVPFLPLGSIAAAKIVVALGFVLPALTMAALARRVWGATGAVLAAAVYTYFPYHLADGLLRGAVAEHLAFLWPPLIFLSLLPTANNTSAPQRQVWRWTLHALAWGGLILTHHLTALMLAPIWAIAVIFLSGQSPRRRQIANAVVSFIAALGLTAFYWLPVIAEASAVKLGADPISTGYRQHLLPLSDLVGRSLTYVYRMAAGQPLQHRLGLLMALLLLLTVAAASSRALVALWRPAAQAASSPTPSRAGLFIFAVVACLLSVALLTTPALPFWQMAEPLLARLQYPWRWLSLTAFASALVIGALPGLITRQPRGQVAVSLPVVALLLFSGLAQLPYTALPRQPADVTPEQMWAEDAANGQVGATWTAEFLPVAVTEQRWALGRAPAQPQVGPTPAAIPDVVLLPRGPLAYRVLMDSPQAQTIRLHTFYFPGWQVRVDGQRVLTGASGDLGLVTIGFNLAEEAVDWARVRGLRPSAPFIEHRPRAAEVFVAATRDAVCTWRRAAATTERGGFDSLLVQLSPEAAPPWIRPMLDPQRELDALRSFQVNRLIPAAADKDSFGLLRAHLELPPRDDLPHAALVRGLVKDPRELFERWREVMDAYDAWVGTSRR